MPRDLLEGQILETIRKYRMFGAGNRVLVAVSGGPDSMALLHLLWRLRRDWGWVLAVAHFDHKMRADSHLDLEFVRQYAERLELPFFEDAADIPALVATRGDNLEQTARLRRRAFLHRVCRQENFDRIATGHTRDDQAETILMNLFRGCGPTGLRGIVPRRGKWTRPLIGSRRTDILKYLGVEDVGFRMDPTNQDARFLRNRIRGQLLPLLHKDYAGNIVERLATAAEIQRAMAGYLKRQCRPWIQEDSSGFYLETEGLRRRPLAEQREAIRLLIAAARGDLRRVSFEQTESVRSLIGREAKGKRVALPGGWEIWNLDGVLRVVQR